MGICERLILYCRFKYFYHGNPDMFDPDDYNKRCKKTFGELYERTVRKDNKIRALGYNLIVAWESEIFS